jgi:uncharacterized cupin superfamily protein
MGEARLEDVGSGLAPVTPGWFVVNVSEAAWLVNEAFGRGCIFEADPRVLRARAELPVQRFPEVGLTLAVLEPGRPSGLYHAESSQEDFLVLVGECLVVIEDEERTLRAWDFVHCPPGTAHVFVGAGDVPCVILMVGGRTGERSLLYPRSDAALRHGAGVDAETRSAAEAYAPFPHWRPARPADWGALPWARRRPRSRAELGGAVAHRLELDELREIHQSGMVGLSRRRRRGLRRRASAWGFFAF